MSSDLKLSKIDDAVLETAIQQIESNLQATILQHIDFYRDKTPELVSPIGQNLRPIPLRPQGGYPGIFGPQPGNGDPYYDIRPNVGEGDLFGRGPGGNLMGPENPFFQRGQQRYIRGDPPFPNLPGIGGLGGPGGFGGLGRFGPMG